MTNTRRLQEAMDSRDGNAIYDVIADAVCWPRRPEGQCIGCSHPEHGALRCIAVPLFTRELRCRCDFGSRLVRA
jgi:hypothetical protein